MRFEDVSTLHSLYSKLGINMSMADLENLFQIVEKGVALLGEQQTHLLENNIASPAWNSPPFVQTMDITRLPNGEMGSSTMKHGTGATWIRCGNKKEN